LNYIITDRTVGQGGNAVSAKVVDKKEKQDLIIAAAIQEFIKKGFAKTTINDIAKAAGIGKGTVYEYFVTKEEIINHTFEYFVRSLEMDFQQVLISELSPEKKLELIFNGFSDFLDSGSNDMVELMFDLWSESIKGKESKSLMFREMSKFYMAYREIFADIIIEGMGDGSFKKNINPYDAASLIVGGLDGIMVQWILDKENFKFRDVVKTASFIFLKGIGAGG